MSHRNENPAAGDGRAFKLDPRRNGPSEGITRRPVAQDQRRAPERAQPLRYPHVPGHRTGPNEATSREGAEFAAKRAGPLKERVIAYLEEGPASPEELVGRFAAAGEPVLLNTIRARCSDLHALGRLKPSGTFGRGESGKVRVIKWRLATPEELSLHLVRKAADAERGEGAQ